ncbi:MAG: 16S rRNA (adenine(1518)-N(6)/adenine(1519)-N(6))-dimethyltransferase, partial [Marinilabiliales bacterium]|nr:16S rRNA (adenine(1518)-N(6)/adenine(1519)-N(6))-dimethyltransferase [Marinilabiliales bacterium]
LFRSIVKQTFNQRRKMLRNGLKAFTPRYVELEESLLCKRPEQLSVDEFIQLTNDMEARMS